MQKPRGRALLLAIAWFKLLKATALLTLGVAAFSLARDSATFESLTHVVGELRLDPHNRLIHRAISGLARLDARRLEELGVGTFVYASVFLVEGAGLLWRKRWAEYLTCIITASFVPLEIYELVHSPSVLKAAGVTLNLLIVGYLFVQLRRDSHGRAASA